MILTESDKAKAKELGLTQQEMRIAKAVHISPERYALSKLQLQNERDLENEIMTAKGQEFTALSDEWLKSAPRRPGAAGLPPEPEEGA